MIAILLVVVWLTIGQNFHSINGQLVPQYTSDSFARPLYVKSCLEPNEATYLEFRVRFKRQDNVNNQDQVDQEYQRRRQHYFDSVRRSIVFNNVVEQIIIEQRKSQHYSNYYYIDARDLYYADISDSELGFLKHTMAHLYELIDRNKPLLAYEAAKRMEVDVPLLSAEGFRQAINILLVRLYDRVDTDQIDKWFEWPNYYKLMSAARYGEEQLGNRRQKLRAPLSGLTSARLQRFDDQSSWAPSSDSSNFNDEEFARYVSSLMVVPFVYKDFFNNIRYNAHGAVNKTYANLIAHEHFKAFNIKYNRTHVNTEEKDRRWKLFRRRWTLIRTLEDSNIVSEIRSFESGYNYRANPSQSINVTEILSLTRFSDLSDTEFIAYLNDDYTDVTNTDVDFVKRSFPLMSLSNEVKWEIVIEIMIRRFQFHWTYDEIIEFMDELLSYMGLPIGPRTVPVPPAKAQRMFDEVMNKFSKLYAQDDVERLKRFETFRRNLGTIMVWHKKDEWELAPEQEVKMFRLADVTWVELKFTIFGLCCLAGASDHYGTGRSTIDIRQREALQQVAQYDGLKSYNSTISYLNSLQICIHQPITPISRQAASTYDIVMRELYYFYLIHYNRHHQNQTKMNERFEIFKQNLFAQATLNCAQASNEYKTVEQLLYESNLYNSKIIDDMHLDSFVYFAPIERKSQGSTSSSTKQAAWEELQTGRQQRTGLPYERLSSSRPRGRADISYRRDSSNSFSFFRFGDSENDNSRNYAREYERNSDLANAYNDGAIPATPFAPDLLESRIFNVTTRYFAAACERALRQQASNGQLGARLANQHLGPSYSNDPCALYQDGLKPWAQGLKLIDVPADTEIALSRARCTRR